MKSKHLAKADFLRDLQKLATELYEFGDFTCDDPARAQLVAKIEGFAQAGTLIEVVTSAEVQAVIDAAHLKKFGEGREARRARILEERADPKEAAANKDEPNWEHYDTPAANRRRK